MKGSRFSVIATAMLIVSIYAGVLKADDSMQVSDFDFRIHLDRDIERMVLTCGSGCTWETLTFACGEESACSAEIDELAFSINLERDIENMVLTCGAGCAWAKLTFDCGADSACSAEIDGRGVITPARILGN